MGKICSQLSGVDLDGKLHKIECIEHECEHYIHILGTHPQTGKAMDHWGCAFSWQPVLTIDNTQQTRQAGAAIESFRNEMVRQNVQLINMASQTRLEKANGESDDHRG